MEFLKKHYEKILLAVLLLVFIGSMLYLMNIVQETAAITKEGLKLPTREPDFEEIVKKENLKFDYDTKLNGVGTTWHASTSRKQNDAFGFSSDLLEIPGVARCGHCERLVPIQFFENKECPFPDCKKILVPPPKVEETIFQPGVISKEDPDGCGIPHHIKTKYNLSTESSDRENVLWDLDNDGFSNLYEYRNRTDMNNVRSHPPLWHRLVLVSIEKVKLPVVYKAVNKMDSEDQNGWWFQINHTGNDRLSDTYKKGKKIEFPLDGYEYMIAKEKFENPNIIKLVPYEEKNAKPIIMELGKDVYSPEPKVFFRDVGNDVAITANIDRPFRMGNARTGYFWYKVRSFDREKNEVYLSQRVGRRGSYRFVDIKEPITLKGKIPLNERVRGGDKNSDRLMDGRNPMMDGAPVMRNNLR